jgi:hypothetical protein
LNLSEIKIKSFYPKKKEISPIKLNIQKRERVRLKNKMVSQRNQVLIMGASIIFAITALLLA